MIFVSLLSNFFSTLYYYREYLIQSVARDLRKKYKRSVLGYFWSMLQPLMMIIILTVVFTNIMNHRSHEDYAVFLFCGLLPWGYFDGTAAGGLSSIRANARILDQMPVPRFIFPVAIGLYNLVTLLLSMVPFVLVILVTGHGINWTALLFPIILLPLMLFTMGVAFLLAVFNVFYEDTEHLRTVVFRALYFLCPILYDRADIPQWLLKWIVINPMFGIIENMRNLFYHSMLPDWSTYGLNMLGAILMLVIGLWVFEKSSDKFIYFI